MGFFSTLLGVIFFGGEARLVVPLTPLADDDRRAALAELIANPPWMSWTDQTEALDLAAQTFGAAPGAAAARFESYCSLMASRSGARTRPPKSRLK